MRLYYFQGACSLAPHIALREAGLPVEPINVDIQTRDVAGGGRLPEVSPKGYVPALILDDGQMLTECVAILDWIGEQNDALRPADAMARTRQIEALAFISAELHKQFLALFFLPGDEAKPLLGQVIRGRFDYLAERLKGDYLLGNRFSVADAFLYVMLRWAKMSEMEVPGAFDAYIARMEARPAVREALKAEGLEPALKQAA